MRKIIFTLGFIVAFYTTNAQVLYGTTTNGGNNGTGAICKLVTGSNTLTAAFSFDSQDGINPQYSTPVQASDGKLYGMTTGGGSSGYGVIFSYDPSTSTYTKLKDFDYTTGAYPTGSLIQASDGKLYGMTAQGGSNSYGVIFSFDPSTSAYIKLKDFDNTNGSYPSGSLIQALDGKLYGMTHEGGSNGNGVIFSYDPLSAAYAKLKDLDNSNGSYPIGSLVQASDGKLYGMTEHGGSSGYGVIFSFDPSTSTYAKLKDFDITNGEDPWGSLIKASDEKLYGMTQQGGGGGYGVIFSFDPSTSAYTKLKDFDNTNGSYPLGNLIQASDGKLYGMTESGGSGGYGVIFSFDPSTSAYTKLKDFDNTNGRYPYGSLVQASDGNLYGMTQLGGSRNFGVIFSFDPFSSTYTKLKDFGSNHNGNNMFGSLMKASDGKLYGMTKEGGSKGYGVIFSYDPVSAAYAKLKDFDGINGASPYGSLVQALDGKLYGMTHSGGSRDYGVIFSYDPISAAYAKLKDLDNTNGGLPLGSLIQASDGNLYGLTQQGGSSGSGVIFSFNPSTSAYIKLKDFDYTNGAYPDGSLIQASDGKLYGMTIQGGSSGSGVIFSFSPSTSTYAKLKDFDYTNGGYPYGSLIQASDGKLYGMTTGGGSSSTGVIFSYNPSTSIYTNLKDFDNTTGANPYGSLIQDSDAKLYGMTANGGSSGMGVSFSYDPVTSTYTKLADFTGSNGSNPQFTSFIEVCTTTTYYRDVDGDGLGDPNNSTQACTQPTGYVPDNTDCNDNDPDQTDFDNDGKANSCDTDDDNDGILDTEDCAPLNPSQLVASSSVSYNAAGLPASAVLTSPTDYTFASGGSGSGNTGGRTWFFSNINTAGYEGLWWTFNPLRNPRHSTQPSPTGDMSFTGYDAATGIATFTSTANMTWPANSGTENIATRLRMQFQPYTGIHGNTPLASGWINPVTAGAINLSSLNSNHPLIDIKALEGAGKYQVWFILEEVSTALPLNVYYATFPHTSTAGGIVITDIGGNFFSSASNCNSATGTVTVTASGGTAPYTGTGTFTAGVGTHNFTVTDAAGCTSITTATVVSQKTTFYADADGDGFGNTLVTTQACTAPAGYVTDNTDCDDTKLLYADNDGDNYGAGSPVACGVADNTDCKDDDASVHTPVTYYKDEDEDGFGDINTPATECLSTPPAGYVTNSADCDDTKKLYADNDEDGFGAGSPVACGVANNTDCNDDDATVNTPVTYYKDADSDGFGDALVTTSECSSIPPAGYVTNSTDCDDTQKLYADNDEDGYGAGLPVACGVANNTDCNDDDATVHAPVTYYKDADGDGFGDALVTTSECSSTPPAGYVTNSTDCDDTQKLYADNDEDGYGAGSPVACGVANNTDCNDDDATVNTPVTYYKDADSDGFGDALVTTSECSSIPPAGYVTNSTDCDDTQKLYADNDEDGFGAGAQVACGVANNTDCNDNDATVHAPVTYYKDEDADGFGDATNTTAVCSSTPPPGYVTNSTDCDDTQKLYADNDEDGFGAGSPVACGVANNTDCNDDDATVHAPVTYYKDEDADGFGDATNTTAVCSSTPPPGYVTNSADCDDTQKLYADNDEDGFGAGAPVACGVPNNTDCNDDDATVHAPVTYYKDEDADGFGDATNTTAELCSSTPPPGYVTNSADCDDTQKLYADNDEDGFGAGAPVACGVANNTDCNDDDATVHAPVTYYRDEDADGFGDATNTTAVCSLTPPAGYVTNSTDCDDTQKLYVDNDEDGYGAGSPVACGVANNTDCNDNDATVHSGITYYKDADGDGFGDINSPTTECLSTAPSGYVTNSTDCDDSKLLYADNDEDGFGAGSPVACGVANNTDCNDNDATVNTPVTYYKDADSDGFGDALVTTSECSSIPPAGYVTSSTDCDDTQKLYVDNDEDGYGAGSPVACGVADNTDCNDNDATVHTPQTYFADNDGDGFGDAANTTTVCSSTPPSGYVTNSTDCDDTQKLYADNDEDGYGAGLPVACGVADNTDCNNNDATVHSGITYFRDADGDGFGDINNPTTECLSTAPSGYVTNSTDCDDTQKLYADNDEDGFGTGSPVACGVANNTDCNDDDASVNVAVTYYKDADGDGFGDATNTTAVCSSTPPPGYVTNSTDCDDTKLLYIDSDGDGFGTASPVACGVANNTDCNDNDASIHPNASEVCDGKDNDCDGLIDEGVKISYYRDADGDGYGNASVTTQACSAPIGYVTNSTDCNDADATVYPNAPEVCDGKDNNCNGSVDESGITTFYRDADGDGYGNAAVTTQGCSAPAGYVTTNTDCNDGDATVRPNAPEVCDGKDNDCDGLIDEGVKITYYRDADGDGYGNASVTTQACSKPAGYVTNNTDCKDADATVYPNAPEVCDGKDNDCDGLIDEVKITYYRDADKDGYGNASVTTQSCYKPAGYVTNNTDCNDANASIRPNAPEVCDGKDNDCDGLIDEGVKTTYYRDADKDGYGNASVSTQACSKPSGYVTNNTDCNDADASIRPNAPEVCDGKDNDCDGLIDEGVKTTYYRDADGDGYGNASLATLACSKPAGYVTNNTDCNDADATIRPNAPEICDGKDNDCDGLIDEGVKTTYYQDVDGDGYGNAAVSTQVCSKPAGYVTNNADCNDNNAAVRPGAAEVCGNGIDDNCNGQIDEGCGVSNIQITITDKSITEGNWGSKLMSFTVKLDQKSAKTVVVNYTTQNVTATAGSDYQSQSGTLTFLPGVTTRTLYIRVYGDRTAEANETFSIALSNAVNATIADATGIGTIINDDGASLIAGSEPEGTKQQLTVELYPNPAVSLAYVSLKGYTGAVTIQLLDMNGKVLKQDKIQTSMQKFIKQPLDVSTYANGNYFISIIDEKGKRQTKRLIIAK